MFSAFTNSMKIPELRSRIFYTLALLFVSRVGAHIPLPGLDPAPLQRFFTEQVSGAGGALVGLYNMFTGGALVKGRRLRAGHHAVHQRVDHLPADDRGRALAQPPAAGGRRRPPEAHPVHPVRHGAHLRGPGRAADPGPGEPRQALFGLRCQRLRRNRHRQQDRIPRHLRHLHDRRHDAAHVAGRADHPARHRQRRLAAHHHRHPRRHSRAPRRRSRR